MYFSLKQRTCRLFTNLSQGRMYRGCILTLKHNTCDRNDVTKGNKALTTVGMMLLWIKIEKKATFDVFRGRYKRSKTGRRYLQIIKKWARHGWCICGPINKNWYTNKIFTNNSGIQEIQLIYLEIYNARRKVRCELCRDYKTRSKLRLQYLQNSKQKVRSTWCI